MKCSHIVCNTRPSEKGAWCQNCGEKIYEVEARICKDCVHFFQSLGSYSGCRKHLMAVSPSMHVTYKISDGSCWELAQGGES